MSEIHTSIDQIGTNTERGVRLGGCLATVLHKGPEYGVV